MSSDPLPPDGDATFDATAPPRIVERAALAARVDDAVRTDGAAAIADAVELSETDVRRAATDLRAAYDRARARIVEHLDAVRVETVFRVGPLPEPLADDDD